MADIHWVLPCVTHDAWCALQMLFHLILSKHRKDKQVAEWVDHRVKFQIYICVTSEMELFTLPPSALPCLKQWAPVVLQKRYISWDVSLQGFNLEDIISEVSIFSYEIIVNEIILELCHSLVTSYLFCVRQINYNCHLSQGNILPSI